MIISQIVSILFLLIALGIMLIVCLFMRLFIDQLLPDIAIIGILSFSIFLVLLSVWSILNSFDASKKERKVLLTICSLVMLVPCIYFGSNMLTNYSNTFFDKKRWSNKPNKRVYMVDNMLKEYNLKGMSKEEIKGLLGEPTNTEYFKTPNNYVYYLGPERGLKIDSEWLVIEFDNGKVKEFNISRD
ncbi:outer membrane protein assembly factor BamE domain-containing protein [Pseudobacteroides cellulosolvens]|uniref:SmpA/OmlA domain-containing protein n=1 Tax=Pseudobacteroides cellulosolvens ATCC 35603 = DSM 2933 TaxID=398512 RepID=A0A0L6JGH8_9FIRM|nr:outer membrane protein assembly factor BamE [Pseudobacteroides cellulosolvens]KNY24809.1 SmpA/OmlA domain-containing protein [Pseudobacteroides cellulosolvens ATCC 35603 = DSM 2933]